MSAPLNEDTPRILSEFSSMANPPIESVLKDKTLEVMLTDGEVGNRGAFDCFVGSVARGFSMFRTPEDSHGSLNSMISLPIENLIFDVLYHRSLPVSPPRLTVFNRVGTGLTTLIPEQDEEPLPIHQPVSVMVGSPPALATALVPRYTEMFRAVCRNGREPRGDEGLPAIAPLATDAFDCGVELGSA